MNYYTEVPQTFNDKVNMYLRKSKQELAELLALQDDGENVKSATMDFCYLARDEVGLALYTEKPTEKDSVSWHCPPRAFSFELPSELFIEEVKKDAEPVMARIRIDIHKE